jgi:hypothetical protein
MEATNLSTTRFRFLLGAAVVVLMVAGGFLLLNATRAEAATTDCCKTSYSNDGKTMTITGYVAYKGELLYMSVGGQKCLSRAGNQRAYIKSVIATKYMPNGRHPISIVSKVNGEVKYFTQWFTITDSPAVSVEVTAPKKNLVLTDSPTIRLEKMGAIKEQTCTLDGTSVGCKSEMTLSNLSEGGHVFKAVVKGRDGYQSTDKKEFKVDTQPPTAPTVSGSSEGWAADYVELRASGSTDASGIASYQHRISPDGGATFGPVKRGAVYEVWHEGETFLQFRAKDRAGRVSEWVDAVARVDGAMPSEPVITQSNGTDACDAVFPLTLTATASDDGSGINRYEWRVMVYPTSGEYYEYTHIGDSLELTEPGYYVVDVQAFDDAGNPSVFRSWSNDSC